MKLADKLVYPIDGTHLSQGFNEEFGGINYRELLILALASNPKIVSEIPDDSTSMQGNADSLIVQADVIIFEMEKK